MSFNESNNLSPRQAKFAKIVDFQTHFKLATRKQGKFHWSHIALTPRATDPHSRLAVVASKKAVDKRAVLRNRAKRRLRPMMRCIAAQWLERELASTEDSFSLHWIVRPKQSATQIAAKELEDDVRQTFCNLIAQFRTRASNPNSSQTLRP